MKSSGILIAAGAFLGPVNPLPSSEKAALYFPPAEGAWETVTPAEAGWDADKLQAALDYAGKNRSSGVVVLHQGRILAEQYWKVEGALTRKFGDRRKDPDEAGRPVEDVASVQKSVASVLVGIAQQKGLLKIGDRVEEHLGTGWSRATAEQEKAISVRHLITMTSGLSDRGTFEVPAGTKWRYNTGVYARSMTVVEKAAGMDRNELTQKWLTGPLGMSNSRWESRGSTDVQRLNGFGFVTTARDLARFGLMMLAGGNWGGKAILSDKEYLREATKSSQELNSSYGYLWWLNRDSFDPANPPRLASAPPDMFSANGALNRRCFVVPSLGLVVTRMGDQPSGVGRGFDREFWNLLMEAAKK